MIYMGAEGFIEVKPQEKRFGEHVLEAAEKYNGMGPEDDKQEMVDGLNLMFESYIAGETVDQLGRKMDEFFNSLREEKCWRVL